MTEHITWVEAPPLLPSLDTEQCVDDRICAFRCPERAIVISDVRPRGRDWKLYPLRCTGCGLCIAACPERALSARAPRQHEPRRILVASR